MTDKTDASAAERRCFFIVDDDESVCRALARAVRWMGQDAEMFLSGDDFLKSGKWAQPGCLIVDLHMPGMSGVELHEHLASLGCTMPVIFISAHEDELSRVQQQQRGRATFLHKPFTEAELREAVHAVLGALNSQ